MGGGGREKNNFLSPAKELVNLVNAIFSALQTACYKFCEAPPNDLLFYIVPLSACRWQGPRLFHFRRDGARSGHRRHHPRYPLHPQKAKCI